MPVGLFSICPLEIAQLNSEICTLAFGSYVANVQISEKAFSKDNPTTLFG